MVPILVSIHFWYKAYKKELAAFCATLQTSSRNNYSTSASSFQTQTIKYLDQIDKVFDVATNQYIEQMEAKKAKSVVSSKGDIPQDFIEYVITKGNTFPCPKCGHMMVMQLGTTETIGAYNHKSWPKPRRAKYKEQRFASYCHKQHCMMADKGGNCCNVVFTESTWLAIACGVDPKELEEDTAPKTMPGFVLTIHESIAEATCVKFLEDTTANKQDITYNQPPSWICKVPENNQESNGSYKKNTIDGKNIDQLRAKHKGKMAVPSNDTWFDQNRRMMGRSLPPPPPTETLINTRADSLFQPITINGETDDSNQRPRTLMGTPLTMAPAKEMKHVHSKLLTLQLVSKQIEMLAKLTMANKSTIQPVMVLSKVQILQALQAKIENQEIAPTNPVNPKPSVPPTATSPSQQEDDCIDSELDSDSDSDSDSEMYSRDDPTHPGWSKLLSLHGIDRNHIPYWIIWSFSKIQYLPHPKDEVNLKREQDYEYAIQRCRDEICPQDEDAFPQTQHYSDSDIDPDNPKWDYIFDAHGIGTKPKYEPESIIPHQEDQEIDWYLNTGIDTIFTVSTMGKCCIERAD
eukprot:jgi/Psemu1/34768/gm1.34768_g